MKILLEIFYPEDMTDAEYTKQLRQRLGLSQKQFAEEFHFTDQQHVSKVERGKLKLTELRREFMELKTDTMIAKT